MNYPCRRCRVDMHSACPYNIALSVPPTYFQWTCPGCDTANQRLALVEQGRHILSKESICTQCPQYVKCLTVRLQFEQVEVDA